MLSNLLKILINFHYDAIIGISVVKLTGSLRLRLTIAETVKPFLKRTDFSSCGACRNCCHVFPFGPTFLFNFEKLLLPFEATIPVQYSNFSDVFCLNCIFVIHVAMKHWVSRSFLKYGVSAVTMAARKI